MRLLLFSDLHRDRAAARNLLELSQEVDVLVGAGDFATTRRGLRDVLDVLRAVDRPAVLVPGNNESFEELQEAARDWPSAVVLHGAGVEIAGVRFWGIGGAIPVTPFGEWSYDFSEDEARGLLQSCLQPDVLVSHSPPRGVLDQSSSGAHLGSVAVLEAISRCQPQLVVCGHIHASAGGVEESGGAIVVNAGPAGLILSLPGRSAMDCDSPLRSR